MDNKTGPSTSSASGSMEFNNPLIPERIRDAISEFYAETFRDKLYDAYRDSMIEQCIGTYENAARIVVMPEITTGSEILHMTLTGANEEGRLSNNGLSVPLKLLFEKLGHEPPADPVIPAGTWEEHKDRMSAAQVQIDDYFAKTKEALGINSLELAPIQSPAYR